MTATLNIETPKTFGFIGRCPVKGCRCVLRMDVPGRFVMVGRRYRYRTSEPMHWMIPELYCAAHKRRVGWLQIDGKVSPDHVCDARCTSAIGHKCECSCGGANHGRAFSI